jgi:cytochrome c oxidase cbb3-type subunit 1
MQNALEPARVVPVVYNDAVVRRFAFMTIIWGIVGMAVGVLIAAQLIWPNLNFNLPYLSYGRLRPLHTNAVIWVAYAIVFFGTLAMRKVKHIYSAAKYGGLRWREV